MDLANLLRGGVRGVTADVMGAPMDISTQLVNLLIAGGGYAAHKAGLVDQPPELLDPRNVGGTSDWFAKGTPIDNQGDENSYAVGRLVPALVGLSRAAMPKVVPSGGAVTKASPLSQKGALYIGKDGKIGGNDLVLTHATDLASSSGNLPSELRNVSLAVSTKNGLGDARVFGQDILVPKPQRFEPRLSPSVLKSHDFFTMLHNAGKEADALRNRSGNRIRDLENRVYGRMSDKNNANLVAGGANSSDYTTLAGKPMTKQAVLNSTEDIGSVFPELLMTTPQFRSFEEFAKSSRGADLLRGKGTYGPQDDRIYIQAMRDDIMSRLASTTGKPPKLGELQDPQKIVELLRVKSTGKPLSSEKADELANLVRESVRENFTRAQPSYAELKRYGPTALNGDNFPAFIATDPYNMNQRSLDTLRGRGINVVQPERDLSNAELFDLVEKLQTQALRGN